MVVFLICQYINGLYFLILNLFAIANEEKKMSTNILVIQSKMKILISFLIYLSIFELPIIAKENGYAAADMEMPVI